MWIYIQRCNFKYSLVLLIYLNESKHFFVYLFSYVLVHTVLFTICIQIQSMLLFLLEML